MRVYWTTYKLLVIPWIINQTVNTLSISQAVKVGDEKAAPESLVLHGAHLLPVVHPELLMPRYPGLVEDQIAKRYKTHQALEMINGWTVQYVTFKATTRASRSSAKLAYFWTYLLANALTAPEYTFNKQWVVFREGRLCLELFNLDGPVPKEIVTELANAMITYTARGFCGLFNARISAPGHTVWASVYVEDGNTIHF